MMIDREFPPPPDVSGYRLDGGESYTISAAQNAALCRSTGIEPLTDGRAHPIYYYIATQIGMGSTVAGLCEACEFDLEDGPLMAGTSVVFHSWPKVGIAYRIQGEILGLTRKKSRKLGVMDLFEYRLGLLDGDDLILETTNRWMLPRKALS